MQTMRKTFFIILAVVSSLLLGVQVIERWRPAVAAGDFYPEDAAKLESVVREYLAAAEVPPAQGRLFALLVPHSAWGLSGKIAAHAFKSLQPGQFDRVIVVTPSHYTHFQGCSLPAVNAFLTPFGGTSLDGPAIRQLVFSPSFSLKALHFPPKNQRLLIHEKEHGIEVLLPFLQAKLGAFKLVPIVTGDLHSPHTKAYDNGTINDVAATIGRIMDERTLLVISTDLTHYGPEFGFAPFTEDVLSRVEQMDREMIRMILQRDAAQLQKYIGETQVNVCGRWGIDLLMRLLPEGTQGTLLAYGQSGRMLETADRSVSYAAMSFYDPSKPPLEPRQPRSLIPISYFERAETAEAPSAPAEADKDTAPEQEVNPEDDGPAE
jgi:AmmeMemoRadiSam system protein B